MDKSENYALEAETTNEIIETLQGVPDLDSRGRIVPLASPGGHEIKACDGYTKDGLLSAVEFEMGEDVGARKRRILRQRGEVDIIVNLLREIGS